MQLPCIDTLSRFDEAPGARLSWRFDELDVSDLRLDKAERMANGWLRVDAVISKVGVNRYLNPDGSERLEARMEQDVFDPVSMRSFELLPLTNEHPRTDGGAPVLLDASNTKRYQVGSVGHVRRDGSYLVGALLVTDQRSVEDVLAGKSQLSPGYRIASFDTSIREFLGQRVDGAQRGIVGNHLAHLFLGRQGPEVAIRLDGDDRAMPSVPVITINTRRSPPMKISIGGKEYEVADDLGSAVTTLLARVDSLEAAANTQSTRTDAAELATVRAQRDQEKVRADAAESKKTELLARVDSLTSEVERLKTQAPGEVARRSELLANAKRICGDDYSQWGDARTDGDGSRPVKTDIEVMRDVILKVDPGAQAKLTEHAANEGYVRARYDMAIELWAAKQDHGADVLAAARAAGQSRTDVASSAPVKTLDQQLREAQAAEQEALRTGQKGAA